jgi:hypothetical protein
MTKKLLSLKLGWTVCDNCRKELLNAGYATSGMSGNEIFPDEWERERERERERDRLRQYCLYSLYNVVFK